FEPDKIRIPVLIKKYIKLNAKIVGFNVDPNFNNTLDGLIFLDLLEVPQLTINQLAKDFNDDKIIDLFYNKRKSSL
ncbi:MAG: glycerol acyltransferase, partial [Flavobacteriales bacterium]|nr:glycerol acyltransferase [Flavobacteriales bacterium]